MQDWGNGCDKVAVTAPVSQMITAIQFVTHWNFRRECVLNYFNALAPEIRDTYIIKIKNYIDKHRKTTDKK